MEEEKAVKSLCRGCKRVAVIVLCACGGSPASLCRPCLSTHIDIHKPRPFLPVRTQQNSLCQLCMNSPSNIICPCFFPPTCLCNECLIHHISKRSGDIHTCLPMQALPYIHSARYQKELEDRKERLDTAKKALQVNVTCLEEAETAIDAAFSALYSTINEQEAKLRKSIKLARELLAHTLQDSIKIIEESIFDTQFIPENAFSAIILTSPNVNEDLKLVSVEQEPIPALDLSRLFHISMRIMEKQDYSPHCLAKVSPQAVNLFDCLRESWQGELQLTGKVDCDYGTCVCFTEETKLFVCGKLRPTTGSACIVSLNSGDVKRVRAMRERRGKHGLIHVAGVIYAFGGLADRKVSLSSCEKFDLSQDIWLPLPSLANPKSAFTPTFHQGKIYLTAGCIPPTTEVLDISTDTLTALLITLPKPGRRVEGDYETCSFVVLGELVVLRAEEEYRIGLEERGGGGGVRARRLETFYPWSNSTPVVIGERVFVVNYGTMVVGRYDGREGRWKKLSVRGDREENGL